MIYTWSEGITAAIFMNIIFRQLQGSQAECHQVSFRISFYPDFLYFTLNPRTARVSHPASKHCLVFIFQGNSRIITFKYLQILLPSQDFFIWK